MLGQAQGRDERAMSVQRRAVVLPMQVAPCFSLPCKLKPMPRQVLVQGFYIRQARLLCVPLAFGSLVVAVACTRQVTRLKFYVSNCHRLSFARMRSMRERRGRSRGSCDEVNRRDRSLCEGGSVPPTIFPVTMKVDPYPGSQHAGRQLDSMERATDRLRRTKSGKPIGRPRIAAPLKDRIRAAHRAGGASLRDLAAQFRVGRETVRRVLCGGD